VPHKANKK